MLACATRPPDVRVNAPVSSAPSSTEPTRQAPQVRHGPWIILNPVHDEGPQPEDVAVMDALRGLPEGR